MAVRRKYIRTVVEEILSKHQITEAPVPVERLAPLLGAYVQEAPHEDKLSGFLLRGAAEDGKSIIGVNSGHSRNRKRFTVGHELGHLLLHAGDRLRYDRAGYGFDLRTEPAEGVPDEAETEANVFAAELLMPARFLQSDLAALAEQGQFDLLEEKALNTLAKKYQVSVQALGIRLQSLGYVTGME